MENSRAHNIEIIAAGTPLLVECIRREVLTAKVNSLVYITDANELLRALRDKQYKQWVRTDILTDRSSHPSSILTVCDLTQVACDERVVYTLVSKTQNNATDGQYRVHLTRIAECRWEITNDNAIQWAKDLRNGAIPGHARKLVHRNVMLKSYPQLNIDVDSARFSWLFREIKRNAINALPQVLAELDRGYSDSRFNWDRARKITRYNKDWTYNQLYAPLE